MDVLQIVENGFSEIENGFSIYISEMDFLTFFREGIRRFCKKGGRK